MKGTVTLPSIHFDSHNFTKSSKDEYFRPVSNKCWQRVRRLLRPEVCMQIYQRSQSFLQRDGAAEPRGRSVRSNKKAPQTSFIQVHVHIFCYIFIFTFGASYKLLFFSGGFLRSSYMLSKASATEAFCTIPDLTTNLQPMTLFSRLSLNIV